MHTNNEYILRNRFNNITIGCDRRGTKEGNKSSFIEMHPNIDIENN